MYSLQNQFVQGIDKTHNQSFYQNLTVGDSDFEVLWRNPFEG